MAPSKTVPLPSPPLSLQPSIPRFVVGPKGAIKDAPARFLVGPRGHELLIWVITNQSGQPITVRMTDFRQKKMPFDKKGVSSVNPFLWLTGDSVNLDDKQTGFIGASVDEDFETRGMFVSLSYTIHVESRAATKPFPPIDYDPDGEIKP